jgi:hypothetical protein
LEDFFAGTGEGVCVDGVVFLHGVSAPLLPGGEGILGWRGVVVLIERFFLGGVSRR